MWGVRQTDVTGVFFLFPVIPRISPASTWYYQSVIPLIVWILNVSCLSNCSETASCFGNKLALGLPMNMQSCCGQALSDEHSVIHA